VANWLGSRRWRGLAAAVIIALLIVTLASAIAGGRGHLVPAMDSAPPLTPEAAAGRRAGLVEASMRNVIYRVDDDITLAIKGLRGGLLPVSEDSLPIFDDPSSFAIEITDAEIAIDTASLGRLLTRYVFAYPGSPLRDLSVTVKEGELVQKGRLKKLVTLPFTIQARLSVTPAGEIRLEPHRVEVLGMGVRGLMDLFGLELDDLVKNNRNHGVRIEEDIVYLDPGGMLPPPRIRGRLREVRVEPGRVVQVFGRGDSVVPPPYRTPDGAVSNYMYFRHSRLRFGKLTMTDADMLIVDPDSTTPLDFSLDRYHEQLVAGYHLTTPEDGLVVYMPDVSKLGGRTARRPDGRRAPP